MDWRTSFGGKNVLCCCACIIASVPNVDDDDDDEEDDDECARTKTTFFFFKNIPFRDREDATFLEEREEEDEQQRATARLPAGVVVVAMLCSGIVRSRSLLFSKSNNKMAQNATLCNGNCRFDF